ncbi:MAG: phosphoribosylanthranilate isomerase [Saprospiraceae bacterium]
MIIKVCGLVDDQNIRDITSLDIDMIGLNFYPGSKRYVRKFNENIVFNIPKKVSKVGVFVDEKIDMVFETISKYKLDYVQLHGSESISYCQKAQKKAKVIKVFGIVDSDNINDVVDGYGFCDFLLFDTKSIYHGGTGRKFNWNILNTYKEPTPFILSGGIGPEDNEIIKDIQHPQLKGIDINSKFEKSPGIKIIEKVSYFINNLKK